MCFNYANRIGKTFLFIWLILFHNILNVSIDVNSGEQMFGAYTSYLNQQFIVQKISNQKVIDPNFEFEITM